MKLGILKLSVFLSGLFMIGQAAHADSNCGDYTGAMLVQCCNYDPQIGINPYTDPPCEGIYGGASFGGVTCPDGSTADSMEDCPASSVAPSSADPGAAMADRGEPMPSTGGGSLGGSGGETMCHYEDDGNVEVCTIIVGNTVTYRTCYLSGYCTNS